MQQPVALIVETDPVDALLIEALLDSIEPYALWSVFSSFEQAALYCERQTSPVPAVIIAFAPAGTGFDARAIERFNAQLAPAPPLVLVAGRHRLASKVLISLLSLRNILENCLSAATLGVAIASEARTRPVYASRPPIRRRAVLRRRALKPFTLPAATRRCWHSQFAPELRRQG